MQCDLESARATQRAIDELVAATRDLSRALLGLGRDTKSPTFGDLKTPIEPHPRRYGNRDVNRENGRH